MDVILYKCDDDPRTLDKTLGDGVTRKCSVYGQCSVVAPALLLRYDATLLQHNYMYIGDWHRYYKIDNISVDRGEQMIVTGTVDVLQTYNAQIKTCPATCIRNEGVGRPTYIPDSSLPLYPDSDYVTSLSLGTYGESGGLQYFLATK